MNYRFKERRNIIEKNMLKHPKSVQLSMSTAFFKIEEIRKFKLKIFDIKPKFEDAHFVNSYVLATDNYNSTYVKTAKYFYRKRKNSISTLEMTSNDVLRDGDLKILKEYKSKLGYVSEFIQNIVL